MRKILKHISLLLFVCSLMVSCSQDFNGSDTGEVETPEFTENEGGLKVSWGLDATTKSAVTKSLSTKSSVTSSTLTEEQIATLMESSVLKIYDSSGNLIRRYEPANNIPSEVYLAEGKYSATVSAGDKIVYATFDPTELLYECEEEFVIKAGEYTNLTLECTMIHAAVKVVFNSTVESAYDLGFDVYVSSSDVFDLDKALSGADPTLTYFGDHVNGIGYFLLTDSNNSFSWGFYGESSNPKIGEQSLTGVIGYPISRGLYTLNFKFSDTPDGYGGITVEIDESMNESEDDFVFVVQPTISKVDNGIESTINFVGDDLTYNIESSLANISEVSVAGVDIYSSTKSTGLDGVTYTPDPSDSKKGVITISKDYFTKFSTAATTNITISVKDERGGAASETASVNVSGVEKVATTDYDLWDNTVNLKATVYLNDIEKVQIAYRESSEDDSNSWTTCDATKVGDDSYAANIEPIWIEGKNENDSEIVYQLDKGIFAGKTYEYKMIVDNVEYGANTFTTTAGQSIPYGDMESTTLTCWDEDDGKSTDWASGNNTVVIATTTLCKQSTKTGMGGSYCAYLIGGATAGNLTAGNVFFGAFEMTGASTGTASFGQKFEWESRPKSLKVKYAATVGTVDYTKYDDFIAKGENDKGRIFLAIVDWGSRHGVTSGTSSPSGSWDPATSSLAANKEIIGYASYWVENTVDTMQEIEIPINYYDTSAKPTSGNYSLVISCSTSAYGEYMNGSSSSKMWVDDFELGY
ncbi:MAG: PCMD domain-containing protein [Rikenellaceae bacterium]